MTMENSKWKNTPSLGQTRESRYIPNFYEVRKDEVWGARLKMATAEAVVQNHGSGWEVAGAEVWAYNSRIVLHFGLSFLILHFAV